MTDPTGVTTGARRSAWKPRIVQVDLAATVLHAVASLLVLADSETLLAAAVAVNLTMFLLGTVAFLVAFAVAADRSRREDVWFGGAFILSGDGTVDAGSRRRLRGCVLLQTLVGLGVAAARPFTAAAFAVLGSLLGWGLMALYGALYGQFRDRQEAG